MFLLAKYWIIPEDYQAILIATFILCPAVTFTDFKINMFGPEPVFSYWDAKTYKDGEFAILELMYAGTAINTEIVWPSATRRETELLCCGPL